MKKILQYGAPLLFCVGSQALAEPQNKDILGLSLKELLEIKVYSVTKSDSLIDAAPASVTVISKNDIARYGYQTIAEALQTVAGFASTDNLVYSDFGVRGSHAGVRAASRIIKVLVNGHPISFRSSGQNFIDDSLFSLAIVERIEIIRGPASTLYGANAYLGVVNIVTTDSPDFEQYRGSISYQDYQLAKQEYQLNLSATGKGDNYQFLLDLSFVTKDRSGLELPQISPESAMFYDGNNNLHATTRNDNSKPSNFFFTWQYDFSEDANMNLQAMRQTVNSDNAFSDLNPLSDIGYNRINIINQQISLTHEFQMNSQHQLRTKFLFHRGDTGDDDRTEIGANDFFLKRRSGFDAIEAQAELVTQWESFGQTLFGFDHNDEDFDLETFYRVERATGQVTSLTPPATTTIDNTGFYAQWQFPFSETLTSIIGHRFDNNSIINSQSSSRIGLVWRYQENLTFKFLAGNSFQSPSAELLFREAVQAGDIIGNENLRPQKAKTYEVVMDWKPDENWYANLTIFQTEVDNLVTYRTDFTNLFAQNSTESKSKGFELELKFNQNQWNAYANLSFHEMEISPDPNNLFVLEHRKNGEIFPEEMINLGTSYNFEKYQTVVSLEHRYGSERPASSQNVIIAQQFYELDAYQVSSLFMRKDLGSMLNHGNANIQFKVRNLFDNRYVNPGFGGIDFPSLGRRYQLTFEWAF
ncbi:TonB-dependent receptor plug domain-containing protein [Aliikangiella coralliicola]|uniref:TonB-dependent receptor n=1 Tax=Aliikangiella coralliicola TaxID=2592383 RepID=A0A545U7L2_9GAMM|nr:TonB-dependent receptor [Aliikangiella coralliicola]TQV85393.1 TonB-dependent receptor [Aliikangiella coralliicola]